MWLPAHSDRKSMHTNLTKILSGRVTEHGISLGPFDGQSEESFIVASLTLSMTFLVIHSPLWKIKSSQITPPPTVFSGLISGFPNSDDAYSFLCPLTTKTLVISS